MGGAGARVWQMDGVVVMKIDRAERNRRDTLTDDEQMREAEAACVPCKLCGGKAKIEDAGPGWGYVIGCENYARREDSCYQYGARISGWAYNVADRWNELNRTDLAQAHAPVRWTQAQQLAFARAYDTEDAAQRGEPTPWVDGEDAGEWVDERLACVRAGIAALEAPAPVRVKPDLDAIESGGKRWHGEDHRVVSVRWEPYKPDGARQMKAKGRWQEQVGSGDYWRWQNCERPQFLAALEPNAGVVAELVEAAKRLLFMVDALKAESGRGIEYGEEDPFRMGEWFDDEELQHIEQARAVLAKLGGKANG